MFRCWPVLPAGKWWTLRGPFRISRRVVLATVEQRTKVGYGCRNMAIAGCKQELSREEMGSCPQVRVLWVERRDVEAPSQSRESWYFAQAVVCATHYARTRTMLYARTRTMLDTNRCRVQYRVLDTVYCLVRNIEFDASNDLSHLASANSLLSSQASASHLFSLAVWQRCRVCKQAFAGRYPWPDLVCDSD